MTSLRPRFLQLTERPNYTKEKMWQCFTHNGTSLVMYVSPLNAMNLIGWVVLMLNHKGVIFGSVLKNVSNFWLSIHISSLFY
jgi:hypothetical protein